MFYSVFALVLAQARRVKQGVLVTTYNFCLLLSLVLLPFASTRHAHWLYFENFLPGLLCISDNLWLEYLHLNVKFNQHLLSLRCGLIIRLIWYIHLKHPVLKFSPSSTHIQVFFHASVSMSQKRDTGKRSTRSLSYTGICKSPKNKNFSHLLLDHTF